VQQKRAKTDFCTIVSRSAVLYSNKVLLTITLPQLLNPNYITLAGLELVRSWFGAGSKLARTRYRNGIWLRTSFEPAPNQLWTS